MTKLVTKNQEKKNKQKKTAMQENVITNVK